MESPRTWTGEGGGRSLRPRASCHSQVDVTSAPSSSHIPHGTASCREPSGRARVFSAGNDVTTNEAGFWSWGLGLSFGGVVYFFLLGLFGGVFVCRGFGRGV